MLSVTISAPAHGCRELLFPIRSKALRPRSWRRRCDRDPAPLDTAFLPAHDQRSTTSSTDAIVDSTRQPEGGR